MGSIILVHLVTLSRSCRLLCSAEWSDCEWWTGTDMERQRMIK